MKEETERVEHYRSHEQITHYVEGDDEDRVDDKDNNDNDNKEE
jgi:hypothetical protein